jgi:hypothetical protein
MGGSGGGGLNGGVLSSAMETLVEGLRRSLSGIVTRYFFLTL